MVIAFFDSGIGGLTVLKSAMQALPQYDFIYYADTKNAPYGVKTRESVREHVLQAVAFISKHDIRALVVACNTATSVAINDLRRDYSFHVLGMEPAIKPAVVKNRGKHILVLATSLTLRAGKLESLLASVDKNNKTVKMEMDALVGFAESWDFDSNKVRRYIRGKLHGLPLADFETIVLGCTHFVFYKKIIQEMAGAQVEVIDGNLGTVNHLKNVLARHHVAHDKVGGHVLYYSSGVIAGPRRARALTALMNFAG